NKYLLLSLILIASCCKAQTVSPDSAKYHEGSLTTVCGKVMGAFTSGTGKVLLNFGADHPNEKFTAVILSSDAAGFKFNPETHYKGKEVCVTGKIKMYKEKPQIVVTSANQINEK